MGTEDNTKEVDPSRLDLSFGGGGSDSLDADREGKAKVKTTDDAGEGMDFEVDGSVNRTGLDKTTKKDTTSEVSDDDNATGDEQQQQDTTTEALEDLGAWDPDNAETAEKFDARYFKATDDGASELNMEAFSAEVAANAAKEDGTPALNEATYGWLKDRMGVSKDYADRIIKGQIALRQQSEDAFYKTVGGKATYEAKLEWAKGAYTPDQKARFNAAIQKGGTEAEEALELLNTRWEKAGNKAPGGVKREQTPKGVPQRRPVSPAKTTTSAENPGGGGGVKPFADADEHRKAMGEAQRSGDKAKIALVRRRLAASTFWK